MPSGHQQSAQLEKAVVSTLRTDPHWEQRWPRYCQMMDAMSLWVMGPYVSVRPPCGPVGPHHETQHVHKKRISASV